MRAVDQIIRNQKALIFYFFFYKSGNLPAGWYWKKITINCQPAKGNIRRFPHPPAGSPPIKKWFMPAGALTCRRRLWRLQGKERRNRIREPSIIFQSWLSGHPQKKMKRDTDKRMTYQDCIPRPLTSSRIPVQWLETWELVFSSTASRARDGEERRYR